THGTLGPVGEDGTATYTPDPDYVGFDNVAFRVDDGSLRSDPAITVIEVTPVNDPPEASNAAYGTTYETPVEITLPATDVDGDALTWEITTQPGHGTLGPVDEDGTTTYTPAAGFIGEDSLAFRASDGEELSGIGTVTI